MDCVYLVIREETRMCSLLWPHANRRCSEKSGSGIGGRLPFQHENLETQPKKLILSEQKERKSRMPYNVDFQSSEQGVLSEQTRLAHTSANFYSCSDIGKKKKTICSYGEKNLDLDCG